MSKETIIGAENSANSVKSKRQRVMIIIAVIIIVVLILIILRLLKKPAEVDNRATFVTEDNLDEILTEKPVVAGSYTCDMNVEWHFRNASEPSYDAFVANSVLNEYTVYFDVTLNENSELVYSSPYLPVDTELNEIKLEKDLSAGTYPATVTYHLVDEEKNELSNVAVTVTLYIEN